MKSIVLIVLLSIVGYVAKAQNADSDIELKIKIKKLNSMAQSALVDGRKAESYAYMDSIAVVMKNGSTVSSFLYALKNIMPRKDNLSIMMEPFNNLTKMSRIEQKTKQ